MSNITKNNNIINGAIFLTLLAGFFSLMPDPKPAAAATEPLRWNRVNIPAGGEAGNWVLAGGSDVEHLAAGSDGTLYASVRGLTDTLYRSTDGGLTWSAAGGVHDDIIGIAVAPRDSRNIYYATAAAVYRSVNGGRTFTALPANPGGAGTGQREITSLDVTSLEQSLIAVGVRDADSAGYGGVYLLDETRVIPSWTDTGIGDYDVYAVAFSPGYASDRQLVAVATDEADTFVFCRSGDSGWNAVSGRARLNRDNSSPPAPVAAGGPATIAFPANYDAQPDAEGSVMFVGVNTGTGTGDVYKISFTAAPASSAATDLNAGQLYGFNNSDISALTVAGSNPVALLIAGAAGGTRTFVSTNGGRDWARIRKEPSGEGITSLLVDPSYQANGRIYAATGGADSALSLSRDGGVTWNQMSLIDTAIDSIIDLAPSPRFTADNTLFMLTFGGGHSLWRSRNGGTGWERILTCAPGGADTLKFVGLPSRYGDACQTIFVAGESDGRPAVWQSTDDGQSYRCRFTRDPATGDTFPIDAWAIIDENSFFVAGYDGSRSLVYLTINGGFIYAEGIPAGSQPLSSLVLSPFYPKDGTLLAGNTDGRVYLYTGNGTASFQPLPRDATAPPLAGSVAVAFDPRFNKNCTVYAAGDNAGGGIYRYNVLTDEEWTSIDATLPAGAVINRLALGAEGTLYAADSSADGGMERCLFPASATDAEFETVTRYLPSSATLSGLWANNHYIWSVDSTGNRLLTFNDTLTAAAGQTSPVNRTMGIGSLTDHTFRNISIDWRALEGATSYQWQCDYTDDFSAVPDSLKGTTSASSVRLPALEPATSYHWRVRASAPVLSPWSEKWSFTTGLETEVITLKPESPSAGANGVPVRPTFQWTAVAGASTYELLVAASADFDHPAVIRTGQYALSSNAWQCDVSLDYGTTYYWKVRAFGGSTSSAWSSTGVFTTGPVTQPVVPALSSLTPPATTLPPHTAVPATNAPVASSLPQVKPAPSSAPPQNIAALPSFNQALELPVWAIYFISALLVIVFLSLVIILTIVLRIRRF